MSSRSNAPPPTPPGPVVVFAPHPDDDAIGCGGTLAQLAEDGTHCTVAYVTDGSRSHPNSVRFGPSRVAEIREDEARRSLAALGISTPPIFMRETDGSLGSMTSMRRAALVDRIEAMLRSLAPAAIFAPWRRDVHSDHVAVAEMVEAALARLQPRPMLLAYAVWQRILGGDADEPDPDEATTLEVTLAARHRVRKRSAIEAHASQTTGLIPDDAFGFRITPPMLAAWTQPVERFLVPALP
jgi:LmbE family N-acetylglucosaminyl deacetylase